MTNRTEEEEGRARTVWKVESWKRGRGKRPSHFQPEIKGGGVAEGRVGQEERAGKAGRARALFSRLRVNLWKLCQIYLKIKTFC